MIEEKVSTSQEPPEIVKVAFDNLMEELANTLTLEESKKIQDRIQLKEDIKLTNIWFDSGPATHGFSIVGLKKAISTYDITDIQFVFIGPKGVAHKSLTDSEKRDFIRVFKSLLLENNYDCNVYQFIPKR